MSTLDKLKNKELTKSASRRLIAAYWKRKYGRLHGVRVSPGGVHRLGLTSKTN